jgi:hypothetical protein
MCRFSSKIDKMKSNKIKFDGDGDGYMDNGVHFVGTYNDYTLCGITMDGDNNTAGSFSSTEEKVDCRDCIAIVEFSKKVKRSEWV